MSHNRQRGSNRISVVRNLWSIAVVSAILEHSIWSVGNEEYSILGLCTYIMKTLRTL